MKGLAEEHTCITHRHRQECGDWPEGRGQQGLDGGGQMGVEWGHL